MTTLNVSPECREYLEYHGNTIIERVRLQGGEIKRDWICFNSTKEAVDFFNERCACECAPVL